MRRDKAAFNVRRNEYDLPTSDRGRHDALPERPWPDDEGPQELDLRRVRPAGRVRGRSDRRRRKRGRGGDTEASCPGATPQHHRDSPARLSRRAAPCPSSTTPRGSPRGRTHTTPSWCFIPKSERAGRDIAPPPGAVHSAIPQLAQLTLLGQGGPRPEPAELEREEWSLYYRENERPQRDSNPCYSLERAVSWAG